MQGVRYTRHLFFENFTLSPSINKCQDSATLGHTLYINSEARGTWVNYTQPKKLSGCALKCMGRGQRA